MSIGFFVQAQQIGPGECFWTRRTAIGGFPSVCPHMHFQHGGRGATFSTNGARIWPLSRMSSHVHRQTGRDSKSFTAYLTDERFFSTVHFQVGFQVPRLCKCLSEH